MGTLKKKSVVSSQYLCVFELLFDILDDGLTVEADERTGDQLGVHRVGAHNLPRDLQQGSDLCRCQLTNPVIEKDWFTTMQSN